MKFILNYSTGIILVESFLKRKLNLRDENIIKLTASDTGAPQPPEPPEQQPTHENMVAAFARITEMAQAGDHIYVY